MRGFLTVLLFLASVGLSAAQVSIKIETIISPVKLDTAYTLIGKVNPGSIEVYDDTLRVAPPRWKFIPSSQTWTLLDSSLVGRRLRLVFLTSPTIPQPELTSKIIPYPPDSLRSDSTAASPFVSSPLTRSDIFGNSNIQRSGSISRGIIFGSNRDASLESGLRLDLSGKITDDIEILATLTDQSTPIQPEGTTQALREFDQVYMRLKSSRGQLQMGDVDVALQSSTFARVNRRLQGLDLIAHTKVGNQRATASVSRGIFRLQQFTGIDGVQGPYRLTGASGEVFIIILAGSENVYLDGIKLTRGEEHDYIIDYGLGEIQFTNKRFISSKSRINVDFQYISQQYSRSLLAAESRVDGLLGGKLSFLTTVIREADSDNSNNQLFLSKSEIEILRRAGDSSTLAVVSGVEPWIPNEADNAIRYVKRDTLLLDEIATYYIPSNDPSQAGFNVRFSRSELRQGSYIRSGTTLNGFVYEWVGAGKGNYDTLRTLASPQEKQIASLQSTLKLNRFLNLSTEIAASSLDNNRFSSIDDDNNAGIAFTSSIFGSLKPDQPNRLRYRLEHSYISPSFSFFDRARSVEFDRLWNITDLEMTKEQTTTANLNWQPAEVSSFRVDVGQLKRERIQSDRLQIRLNSTEARLPHLEYQWSIVSSVDSISSEKGSWIRHGGQLSKPSSLGKWVINPGVQIEQENRDQKELITDSLSINALKFIEFGPFISLRSENARWSIRLSSLQRKDEAPKAGVLIPESESRTHSLTWSSDQGAKFFTEQSIGIRNISYDEGFESLGGSNNSLQIRSVVRYRLLNRFLDAQWNYDLSSERRAKLQERYIEVGPELGSYIWEDSNGDGIKDIDEFFPERIPGEGIYLLQFVPADEFVPVTSLETGLRHVFRFSELKTVSNHPIWKRLEFTSRLALKEISKDDSKNIYLLKWSGFQGSNTLQGRQSAQHELRFSQGLNNLGLILGHDIQKTSNAFNIGTDSNRRNAWRANAQYRISDQWSTDLTFTQSMVLSESEQLSSRRYNIRSDQVESDIQYRYSNKWISRVSAYIIEKTDRKPLEPVVLNAWGLDAETTFYYGKSSRTRITAGRRMNRIEGTSSSYGLFELTDGGAEGVVWSSSVQSEYRISDFVRASLNYDLRYFEGKKAIQTLRFVVSAVL